MELTLRFLTQCEVSQPFQIEPRRVLNVEGC